MRNLVIPFALILTAAGCAQETEPASQSIGKSLGMYVFPAR